MVSVVRLWFGLLLAVAFASSAGAANYPCSGSKGGIARCNGDLFICNDGSISGSKKSCAAEHGSALVLAAPLTRMTPGDCSCRSNSICTGPRGGHYCLSDSGTKSYVRK